MVAPFLLDVDGVLLDFVGALTTFMTDLGHTVRPEDVTTWDLERLSKNWDFHKRDALKMCLDGRETNGIEWHQVIKPYPGALDFVKRLEAAGPVLYVTSPLAVPHWHQMRELALKRFFDAKPSQVVFAHSNVKRYVRGEALVEDRYDTALSWAIENPGKFAYVMARPWNTSGGTDPQQYRYSHDRVKLVHSYGEIRP